MLSLQKLAEIAARHFTAMADAMVAACVAKALETGEVLRMPERSARPAIHVERPAEEVNWTRMVEGNSDSRWQHV